MNKTDAFTVDASLPRIARVDGGEDFMVRIETEPTGIRTFGMTTPMARTGR